MKMFTKRVLTRERKTLSERSKDKVEALLGFWESVEVTVDDSYANATPFFFEKTPSNLGPCKFCVSSTPVYKYPAILILK